MSIIIRPVITEKTGFMGERNQYVFEVKKDATKIQIRESIKALYPNVTIQAVNTLIVASKPKSRFARGGFLRGRSKVWKKAIITLKKGDTIDLFSEI
jgi:large subunit ribosomal protein L23